MLENRKYFYYQILEYLYASSKPEQCKYELYNCYIETFPDIFLILGRGREQT